MSDRDLAVSIIDRIWQENIELRKELAAKQAKIDSLILEWCPEEMTLEQIEEWGRNQRAAAMADHQAVIEHYPVHKLECHGDPVRVNLPMQECPVQKQAERGE